jgi:hypothetical protein
MDMPISRHTLIAALLIAAPITINAQPPFVASQREQGFTDRDVRARRAPIACAMAARSVRDWGWGIGTPDPSATPLASIVSAVNYQLRANAGQLGAEDLGKLKTALASNDPCVRELSLTILATQSDGRFSRKSVVRVAQNGREKVKIRD